MLLVKMGIEYSKINSRFPVIYLNAVAITLT